MKIIKLGFGLLIIIVSFSACSKEDSPKTTLMPVTIDEALKGNKWQLNSLIVYQPANTPILNLTTINFQPCELDNYFTFGVDNSFRVIENGTVCSPPGNSKFPLLGSWLLNTSDSTLTLGTGFITEIYKVVEVNNSKMRWEQTIPDYLGGKQIYEYTLLPVK